MSWLIAVALFASWAKHGDGIRVVKKSESEELTQSGLEPVAEAMATGTDASIGLNFHRRRRGHVRRRYPACSSQCPTYTGPLVVNHFHDAGWWTHMYTFKVAHTGTTVCVDTDNDYWDFYFPVGCGAISGPGLPSGEEFITLMKALQDNAIPQGGFACGWMGQDYGCSCGHNQGNTTPCHLPISVPPGGTTQGGYTCGHYGVLYGCAAWHNGGPPDNFNWR